MIISKIWIFKLPDIDQGIQKYAIQKTRSLEHFWKKLSREKEKNIILVYPGLRYTHKKLNFDCKIFFFKKCLFEYENHFAVKKHNNFLRAISKTKKRFCCHHKKMLVIQFPYMEIVWLAFFWQKVFLFYLERYTKVYAKTREKFFENSMTEF